MNQSRNYQDKFKIDKVVDLLSKKSVDLFYSIDHNLMTIINEGKFRLKSIDIFYKDKNSHKDYQGKFLQEVEILSTIENIDRAMYLFLDSKCEIPIHVDDDDDSYRIVTGVIISDKIEITVLNTTVDLNEKQSIGFEASEITHSAINYGVEPSTILVVCLSKNCFDTKEMIKIYNSGSIN